MLLASDSMHHDRWKFEWEKGKINKKDKRYAELINTYQCGSS